VSAADIIAELPRLSSAELAQVEAKLRELILPTRAVKPPRIHSPRLAHPEQSKDFIKQVMELPPMPSYDALHYDPPAPIARVVLRAASGATVADVLMLLDTVTFRLFDGRGATAQLVAAAQALR
jgi:hypothetical protein